MAFTKVLGPGIHTLSNITSHNINSTGIITAVSFVGDGSSLTGIANTDFIVGTAITMGTGNFTGNLTVGGVLTYEDVKNVDSIGVVTARTGLKVTTGEATVGSNIKLGNAGVITATSFHGSGASLTGIDATALKDPAGNVKIQAQASGAVHTLSLIHI